MVLDYLIHCLLSLITNTYFDYFSSLRKVIEEQFLKVPTVYPLYIHYAQCDVFCDTNLFKLQCARQALVVKKFFFCGHKMLGKHAVFGGSIFMTYALLSAGIHSGDEISLGK